MRWLAILLLVIPGTIGLLLALQGLEYFRQESIVAQPLGVITFSLGVAIFTTAFGIIAMIGLLGEVADSAIRHAEAAERSLQLIDWIARTHYGWLQHQAGPIKEQEVEAEVNGNSASDLPGSSATAVPKRPLRKWRPLDAVAERLATRITNQLIRQREKAAQKKRLFICSACNVQIEFEPHEDTSTGSMSRCPSCGEGLFFE